jgi:cation diffusion facilitator CzcD-associated flavoprotein CzcO
VQATAVTIVPAMAEKAAKVTMLQRSPTYIAPAPSVDTTATFLRKWLTSSIVHKLMRWKKMLEMHYFYTLAKRCPELSKRTLKERVRGSLPPDFDVDKHFTPSYDPWDQRICISPDGDFFDAVRTGKAAIVTDAVERFTERGILLQSGSELRADVIVTATGLEVLPGPNVACCVLRASWCSLHDVRCMVYAAWCTLHVIVTDTGLEVLPLGTNRGRKDGTGGYS